MINHKELRNNIIDECIEKVMKKLDKTNLYSLKQSLKDTLENLKEVN